MALDLDHKGVALLLRLYAAEGETHYKQLSPSLRKEIDRQFPTLFKYGEDANWWLKKFGKQEVRGGFLFPAPKPQDSKRCPVALFAPNWVAQEGQPDKLKLSVFMYIEDGNAFQTVGFRIEPGDMQIDVDAISGRRTPRTHAYTHVQFCRVIRLGDNDVKTTLPEHFPDSYPAFASRCERLVDPLFTMMAALHGYAAKHEELNGVQTPMYALRILGDIIPKAQTVVTNPQDAYAAMREFLI